MRRLAILAITCALASVAAFAADISQISPCSPAAAIISARPAQSEPTLEIMYKVEGGEAADLTIDLAKSFAARRQGNRIIIDDYALRRVITVDLTTLSFQNTSLYGLVDFLAAETFNRRM